MRKYRERRLLRRAARGDHGSLEQFYEQHVDAVYAFVFYRVGKDRSLAEDAVSETFARALKRQSDFDPKRGSVRAWLITLARNAARDQLRAHEKLRAAAQWEEIDRSLAAVFGALDDKPLSDEVIVRAETRDMVNMTIAHLPDQYGRALQAKYVEGLSLAELGRELGVTEDAAKSLLARARRAFRDAFFALTRSMAEVSE